MTADQLLCTNALTEFRFRWQYLTPDISSASITDISPDMLYTFFLSWKNEIQLYLFIKGFRGRKR